MQDIAIPPPNRRSLLLYQGFSLDDALARREDRRRAGLAESGETERQEGLRLLDEMVIQDRKGPEAEPVRLDGSAGVILDPLAQVEVGMLVPVVIDRPEHVMDGERGPQRGHGEEDRRHKCDEEELVPGRCSDTHGDLFCGGL